MDKKPIKEELEHLIAELESHIVCYNSGGSELGSGAIEVLESFFRKNEILPKAKIASSEPSNEQIDKLAEALGIRTWDMGDDGFGGEWIISPKKIEAIKKFWKDAFETGATQLEKTK